MQGEHIQLEGFTVGQPYSRIDIAEIGAVRPPADPRDPHWSQGIVRFDNAVLLLVTLDKSEEYQDYFDGSQFWWQSQNQQTQRSPVIRAIAEGTLSAHLFVRRCAKVRSRTQPFLYCGALSTPEMEGERPVTCLFDCLDFDPYATGELADIYAWRPETFASPTERKRQQQIRVRRPSGQGRQLDAALRKALEKYGMDHAIAHYSALGFEVIDTSLTCPYDLLLRNGGALRRVEVKATVTLGTDVIVTAGEVRAALDPSVSTDLYVVHSISVRGAEGVYQLEAGQVQLIEGWRPSNEDLSPTEYRYRVPKAPTTSPGSDA